MVEDDDALRDTLVEVLADFGYRGVGAATTDAATAQFARETPKLILHRPAVRLGLRGAEGEIADRKRTALNS